MSLDPIGIDLRRELEIIMRDHGTWGLLRKRIELGKRAASYNAASGEAPQPGEKGVMATGEGFVDYLIRYRRMMIFEVSEQATSSGREGPSLVRFYLQWNMKPDVHDFLIEVAQDESSQSRSKGIQPIIPFKMVRMWDIQEVNPMRDRGGRVEFWQVFAREAVYGGPS